jgi:hypothetical protein
MMLSALVQHGLPELPRNIKDALATGGVACLKNWTKSAMPLSASPEIGERQVARPATKRQCRLVFYQIGYLSSAQVCSLMRRPKQNSWIHGR